MPICSLQFLAMFTVVSIVFQLFPRVWQRQVMLSLVNLGFLALFVPSAASWLGFGIFILAGFFAIKLIKVRPSGWLAFAILLAFVASFLVVKRYSFLAWVLPRELWNQPLELVGVSYMLFKFIHMLVDQWQWQLAPCDLFGYANYQLAFFTLTAGPIQRYNDFHRGWQSMDAAPESTRDTLLAWSRILSGIVKMGLIATAAHEAYASASRPELTPLVRCAAHFYGYAAFLYFNFSGYTDIVIGCGRILGFTLPENFNRPYLARNIIDFWNRWHISLTHWIRDYVFMTSYKAAAERHPRGANYFGYGLIFLSLLLAGVWHGSTAAFAAFGAIHGLGAAANQAYGDALKAKLGRAGLKRYLDDPRFHALAVFLTFNFVCLSLTLFSPNTRQTWLVLNAVVDQWRAPSEAEPSPPAAPGRWEIGALVFVLVLVGARWKGKSAVAFLRSLGLRTTRDARGLYAVVTLKIVLIVLCFLGLWAIEHQDPVVVYIQF